VKPFGPTDGDGSEPVENHSAEKLLGLPVRFRGISLGRPVDLIVDRNEPRALGFDVLCGDNAHRFLPFAVARISGDAIEIETPFVLLDFGQVAFYREHSTTLRELNGDSAKLVVDRRGSIERVVSR
jgi:hypothetical protein